jgi:lipoate-protein ligase A
MGEAVACRLLFDPPNSGAWNMAVDEVLLDRAGREQTWTLRFYEWLEPTVSLGYFQDCASRFNHPASRDCPLVRRPTGGGAIVHDQELTYALFAPAVDPLARDSHGLYRAVHSALVRVLAALGVETRMHEVELGSGAGPRRQEPFLCFERRSAGDLLVGASKVGGSAQRRRSGAVLQHGSFLLRRSPAAPELPGIEDLCPRFQGRPDWRSLASSEILAWLKPAVSIEPLSDAERRAAAVLVRDKYGNPAWNGRR